MTVMKEEYIEKIYAGWLAKTIGIRLGAPIEGWTYERIKNVFGVLSDYPSDFKQFAADDDSNGPIFFIRALEDSRHSYEDMTAQDVGDALLNYAPFESGFFWWGGYGTSTEHTAYLNLRAGIRAPQSGSIEQNGSTVAEQIGGQIFIDTWGLVAPGNPDLAAKYAEKAASVTHGGNGVYGGIFVAVCISYAFEEQDIVKIIEKGLSYIPADCEYTRAVRAVMDYYKLHPENWRNCFQYVFDNFGYDRYPGNCHIIPNVAVMILALLYGEGDFSDTINICNMCGWDTDCNVGNVAAIMGVRCGLKGIDYDKWRKPINDIMICSSVVGSLNISDIPYGASYVARLAASIAKEELPGPWDDILNRRPDGCHFEYPGSTHGMRVRTDKGGYLNYFIRNTDEEAHTGNRALSLSVSNVTDQRIMLYKKTYYTPDDFDYGRYDPSFSPVVYPGQTITGSLYLPAAGGKCVVRPYVHDLTGGKTVTGQTGTLLKAGEWVTVSMKIPAMDNVVLDEAGFVFDVLNEQGSPMDMRVLLDDFYINGNPDYGLEFTCAREECWETKRREISQFTRMKGHSYLAGGSLHLSCSDFGEIYTGGYDWTDYKASFRITPDCGTCHMVNVRVQGAIRSYAAGFMKAGKLGFYKNENGYRTMAEMDFSWTPGREYIVQVTAERNRFAVAVDGKEVLSCIDEDFPYLNGGIGLSVRDGSHIRCRKLMVRPL